MSYTKEFKQAKKKKRKSVQVATEVTKKEQDDQSIDFGTLRKIGGFFRNKEEILAAMLKSDIEEGVAHPYGEGEAGFARFIDSQKLFYKRTGDRYTPLNVSTITTYLRNVKSKVLAEIAAERAEEKKRKEERRKKKINRGKRPEKS